MSSSFSASLSSKAASSQPSNRNFLSPIGFKFILTKCPKVDFFSNSAAIPAISLGSAVQNTPLRDIPIPGDKLIYDDFQLRFIVDENMENYYQIHKWLRDLGYPESIEEIYNLAKGDPFFPDANPRLGYKNIYSDGTLQILNSNYNIIRQVKFNDLYPTSLSTLEFDATEGDYSYFTAVVNFKYTIYNILDKNGKTL